MLNSPPTSFIPWKGASRRAPANARKEHPPPKLAALLALFRGRSYMPSPALLPAGAAPAPARLPRRLLPQRVADSILLLTWLTSAAVCGVVVWQLVSQRAERHVIAISTAGFAVAIALPLSVWDTNKHVQHFVSPLQRHYIRILLMVPICACRPFRARRSARLRLNAFRASARCARASFHGNARARLAAHASFPRARTRVPPSYY